MVVNILDNNVDLVKNASDAAIKRALTIIGLDCENYAKANAPVDTGALRNSITSVVLDGENAVEIGSNIEYAPYQELGTSRMQACNEGQGFLGLAINDHLRDFETIVKNELENG